MIKAVIFDVGGTLHTQVKTAESTRRFRALVRAVLSRRGILSETDDETLFSAITEGARRYKQFSEEHPDVIWQDYFLAAPGFDKHLLEGLGEELCCIFDLEEKEIIPREGLQETISGLRARGYRLGILSNVMSRTMVGNVLERHGLSGAFPYVLQSSVCKIRKPDPRIFEICLHDMGLSKHEVIYVGDTVSRDHRDTAYRDMGVHPTYFIHALPEILPIMDSLRAEESLPSLQKK